MYGTGVNENYGKQTRPLARKAAIVSVIAFGLGIGTGGAATLDYLKERGERGYRLANFPASPTGRMFGKRAPAEDIDHIRKVLIPSMTDLANALGVSRQAVYSWHDGKPITQENAVRLSDLGQAADLFAQEGLAVSARLLRRPIAQGKNLLEIVRDGGSAKEAASVLIDIVRHEADQHHLLQTRLAKRPRPSRDEYEDIGIPTLNERD